MRRGPVYRRLAVLAALILALPPLPRAQASISLNYMQIDAGNARLPTAIANLGIGTVFGHAYGMKCDSASDDTAALQAAVNAAEALAVNGGATLYLPAGYCIVSGTINITSGIRIVGAGIGESGSNSGGTAIRDSRTTGDVFAVAALGGVTFRDFAIDTPGAYKTSGACISLNGTGGATYNWRSRIDSVYCVNSWDGLRMDEAAEVKVFGFKALDYGHDGILKINSQIPDGGQDAYVGVSLQTLNRSANGTETSNPFATSNGQPSVTVTHTAHGLAAGQIAVWEGATTFNNVTISGAYVVQSVVDANHFTITAQTTANASGSGGGTPGYWYGPNAGFEFQAGGDIALADSKLIGNCYNFLLNLTYGPTGSARLTGNSLEQDHCAQVAALQAVSGKEFGNLVIVGNQFSQAISGAQNQPSLGGVYIGAGTPNTAPKWIRNIVIQDNAFNDVISSAVAMIDAEDGDQIAIGGNVLNNNTTAGETGIKVGGAATHVSLDYDMPTNLPSGVFAAGMQWANVATGLPPAPNLLINGGMAIDQVNEGAAIAPANTARAGCVDEWEIQFNSVASGITCQRVADAPLGAQYSIKMTIGTGSATVGASDYVKFDQRVEANQLLNSGLSTANAASLTLSLWVKSSITGTFAVTMENSALTRSFVNTCTIAATATWQHCVWVVPGDTAAGWVASGTALGLYLQVMMEAGSSLQGTPLQWNAADVKSTAAQTQWSTTTGATFQLTAAKLEVSPVPTAFATLPFAAELARAQRYYAKTFPQGTAVAQSAGLAGARCAATASTTAGTWSVYWPFPAEMRSSPTITTYNPAAANANIRDVTGAADAVVNVDPAAAKGTTGVMLGEQTTALTAAHNLCIHATADARL